MNDFQYDTPHSLGEAFSLLEKHGDDARIIAGGTALILFMNQRLVQPGHLLSLQRIPGLDGISATDDGIHIGAMCTHREVETSAVLKSAVPLLCETYHHVATPRIRNMATVGGGLIHADPNLDPPPSLIVLGAQATFASATGQRKVAVEELFLDYYETVIRPEEILTQVEIPPLPPNSGTSYIKFLPRTADDYATVSVAALLTLAKDGSTCEEARIALGSLGSTPIRARKSENILKGHPLTPDLIQQAAEVAEGEVDPMDDFRGSSGYKRQMAKVFTRRALEHALDNVRGASS